MKWSDLGNISYELTLQECLKLFIALLAIGVLAFSFIFEHWTIIDSLYFTTVCLTTVGYGVSEMIAAEVRSSCSSHTLPKTLTFCLLPFFRI